MVPMIEEEDSIEKKEGGARDIYTFDKRGSYQCGIGDFNP